MTTATIEPRHHPLLQILTAQRLDELAADGQLPSLDDLAARTAAHLTAQLQLLDLPPDELAPIIAAADNVAREQLKTRERIGNFESDDLAETLLVRLGLTTPADKITGNGKRTRRRTLRTPSQVIRAIADLNADLENEAIDPRAARARLYALQTMLVAMKMQPTLEPPSRRRLRTPATIPMLEAAAEMSADCRPDGTHRELADLMQQTNFGGDNA
jgi:hypothetical protein